MSKLSEMETIEGNKITNETLRGVSLSSQPSNELHKILKPSSENEVFRDEMKGVAAGGGPVVVATVVEKTEVTEKNEKNEIKEDEKEGVFGTLVDGDEGIKVNSSENGSEIEVKECEIDESKEDNGKRLAENKEEYDDEQDEIEEDHGFVVGDFVWGKIKSHPWWPGQIYDPSDASDYAATLNRNDRLLVAFLGDNSFSWCSPSQLKPFVESFQEMSNQTDSKKFGNAVQKVLEEVSRLVEAELMCESQPVEPVRTNKTIRVLIDRMQPVEILSILKDYAIMEPGTRNLDLDLEFTVLKRWLSAFYRKKGGYFLPEYHNPKCIEGLEDDQRSGSDLNGPSESAENGDDKMYQKRKQKSVAELLGNEVKVKKSKTSKDGGSGGKSTAGIKRERKQKTLVVSVTPESDQETGGGGGGEDTMSPRQRKKSKYLSPPYLSPIWIGKLPGSGSGSFKEPKIEPEKVPEIAAKQLEESFNWSSGRKSRQRRRGIEGSDSKDSKDERKTIVDVAVDVVNVVPRLLRAALDPTSFVDKKNLPEVTEFVSSFRSFIFQDGSGRKKRGSQNAVAEETSDPDFIERKLESMIEMVKNCGEDEMSAEVKVKLEEGMTEVLEKVGKIGEK